LKTLLFIILLFFSITCFSQWQKDTFLVANFQSVKQEKSEKWKVIALYSGSIILNGIGDGLNDSKQKTAGHLFNAASIGTLLVSPALFNYQKDNWIWYVLSYTCLRAALFDITYNLTRNLPFNYTGLTSITDKIYNSLGVYPIYPRAIFFIVGFAIPLTKL
jgi:hypothetical protein